MKAILNAIRTDEGIDALILIERLERLEVPEELSKNSMVNPGSPRPFWSRRRAALQSSGQSDHPA
jgi:hypothetical protein